MRRHFIAACAAALGLGFLLPVANAVPPDSGHKLEFWTPVQYDQQGRAHPQPATANHNATVWSNDEVVTVKADFVDGVKKWEVRLVPVNGGAPSTCREEIAPLNNSYPNKVYINCPWDTTRAADRTLDGRTPYEEVDNQNYQRNWRVADRGPSVNGRYTIEVTVWNAGREGGLITPGVAPDQPFQLFQDPNANPPWRQVWVANGVADPTGVSTAFDRATNRIAVTWAPNPEPDVSYRVQEKIGNGGWSEGVDVPGGATRYERAVEHPGSYSYQVQAIRRAPTADDAGAVKRSRSVATTAVEVAQITPPTTAGSNSADGVPDGGEPGVFIPRDTSTTTAPGGTRGTARPAPAPSRSGPTAGFRPSGSAGRPTGTTDPGEAEGEEPDGGYSATLPYDQRQTFAEVEEGEEEAAGPALAGGVVPKPRDTRQLLIFMAISLTLFVFAMQLTVLVRKSKPVPVGANHTYQDDFDDWLGGF